MKNHANAVRLALLAAGLVVAGSTASLAQPGQRPLQIRTVTDKLGFQWDVQNGGYIARGMNRSFSGACQMMIDGGVYHPNAGTMSADGTEYLFRGNRNGWSIERRVKVDLAKGVVRYVDSMTNTTQQRRALRFGLMTNFGRSNVARMVSNGGKNVPQLPAGEEGVLCWTDPRIGQVAGLFLLAGKRTKVRPQMNVQNNRTFRFDWTLQAGPGETVSIAHAVAQRNFATVPSGRSLDREFDPLRDTGWIESLPGKIAGSVANMETHGSPQLGPAILSPERIGLDEDELDLLALGNESRLLGTADLAELVLETEYGPVTIPTERIATLVGPRYAGGTTGAMLRDGQCLVGRPVFDRLAFALRGGLTTTVEPDQLDRVVFRRPEERPASAKALLETVNGDRLAFDAKNAPAIPATTPWGVRRVEWNEISRLAAQETGGFVLELHDGTRAFCFLDAEEIEVATLEFGPRRLASAEIRMISLVPAKKEEGTDGETEPMETTDDTPEEAPPLFELVGGNRLAGQLVADRFRFATATQEVPLLASDIRTLQVVEPNDASEKRVWEARVWNGSVLRGRLLDRVLEVDMGPGSRARIPARDLERFHVPTLPSHVRELVEELLADLGDPEFGTRDAATRELAVLVDVVRPMLEQAVEDGPKLEIRRRLERVLKKGE